ARRWALAPAAPRVHRAQVAERLVRAARPLLVHQERGAERLVQVVQPLRLGGRGGGGRGVGRGGVGGRVGGGGRGGGGGGAGGAGVVVGEVGGVGEGRGAGRRGGGVECLVQVVQPLRVAARVRAGRVVERLVRAEPGRRERRRVVAPGQGLRAVGRT